MAEPVIVVGGQAGSEGKGAVCARLQQEREFDYAVRVGGPNAGHTVVGPDGRRYPLRQLPVAAVASEEAQLVVAAGSEVDLEVLHQEIDELEGRGYKVRERLLIDREATVVEPKHAKMEGKVRTGTTGKGIGAARAERALRRVRRMADFSSMDLHCVDTQPILRGAVRTDRSVLVEGTQGFVLGSHAGYYPYCTSGDCRAIDFMAACGLPPMGAEVWVVLRTYPIRIAGNSGPLLKETDWEAVGVQPEITTVTKKVRRVGEWDQDWANRSVEANTSEWGVSVALTFADYWWPELAGWDGPCDLPMTIEHEIKALEMRTQAKVRMLGTGPSTQILRRSE